MNLLNDEGGWQMPAGRCAEFIVGFCVWIYTPLLEIRMECPAVKTGSAKRRIAGGGGRCA